ncbi:Dam family site-specific DNA-(adenine-N6)-methyltransferase [bacterium]|nr:Dam family site-specific DNA-(adenine-N6)-methyltransferase [bacterium]
MRGPANVPQPIPYQGSKRQLAPQILRYFPDRMDRLVEPFAGSAAISIAVAARGRAKRFWINDAHQPLISLWQEIVESPERLADEYERLWHEQAGREREFFDEVRDRFNQTHGSADFLYLLARCVKAAIRYNSKGEFNNTPDNRRKGARPAEMRQRIETASALFQGRSRLTSFDYREVLSQCGKRDLIYMDPPYQGVCGNRDQRYLPTISHDEFCAELERLVAKNIMFAVSYDGRTGDKVYGEPIPESLGLRHLELHAGRSTQATLLGRDDVTYEGFYLSPALAEAVQPARKATQLALW